MSDAYKANSKLKFGKSVHVSILLRTLYQQNLNSNHYEKNTVIVSRGRVTTEGLCAVRSNQVFPNQKPQFIERSMSDSENREWPYVTRLGVKNIMIGTGDG